MTEQTLSPDTDRRFVESVIARGILDAATVGKISGEYERELSAGSTTVRSLAQLLCARGVLDRRTAAEILHSVRAERARDSTWPKEREADEGAAPTRIGEYDLEGELGRGGMGAVWLGRHRVTGATRALKFLDGAGDAERLARFRLEAEALARVGGDVVVPVHEVGVSKGRIFFAMGVMNGGSLRARLNQRGPLPWHEAVELAVQIARALARCHAVGLIHRDLKPDNVLLDTGGRPRLADFGVARDLTGGSLTETGTVLGTPVYMPPEQLEGLKVDARADIYALGALLHELLSGERPYVGRSVLDVFEAKKKDARGPLPASVPPELGAVLARALAPSPEARHASALELAADLERILLLSSERKAAVASPIRALVWVLVAGVAVLVVEGGILIARTRTQPAPLPPVVAPLPQPPPVTPGTDDLAAANRELLAAAAILSSSRGSVEDALTAVERAREACPGGAIPAEGLARVNGALLRRVEAIASVDPAPGPHLDAPYRDLRLMRRIAARLGGAVVTTQEIALFASAYAFWQKGQKPPDWESVLEAGFIVLERVSGGADDIAAWSVACAEQVTPPPAIARIVIERACEVVRNDKRLQCHVRYVQFLGLVNDPANMASVAADVLRRDPSPERARAVVRAIAAAPGTLLAPAQLDALVEAGGATPELVLFRGLHDPGRRMEIATALERGLADAADRQAAAAVVVQSSELRRPCLRTLLSKGALDLAAFVLSQSPDPAIKALAPLALEARTASEQESLLHRLER